MFILFGLRPQILLPFCHRLFKDNPKERGQGYIMKKWAIVLQKRLDNSNLSKILSCVLAD